MLRFGTDGIRGAVGSELSDEIVTAVGRAAVRALGAERFVVGRDTRHSGPRFEASLASGITAEGAQVEIVGMVPTPAVAWASAHDGIPGAVISASHNPAVDNGVKLFGAGGRKLDDDAQAAVVAELDQALAGGQGRSDVSPGTIIPRPGGIRQAYLQDLAASIEGRRLDGVKVVLDCANGAGSVLAPQLFRRLGAELTTIAAEPDGHNINEGCGSTHMDALRQAVRDAGADVGIALDGDADRALAVDAEGEIIDGDHIIAMAALDFADRGRLAESTVVVTVMTNLGFHHAMANHGIEVVETPVGDRHVLAALEDRSLSLGGEQSGHVIFTDWATTGDGLLTGLQVVDLLVRSGLPLADLAAKAMTALPQVLRSATVVGSPDEALAKAEETIAATVAELGESGRVLVRPSGTEPVVRVMAEAPTRAGAEAAVDRIIAALA